MDSHLKKLFMRYRQQFGCSLMNVENISPSFIKSLYDAAAALYTTDPWKRLTPDHLFGLKVGKDSDWTGNKQPFSCLRFIDVALYMYRSQDDAANKMMMDVEVLRVTYNNQSQSQSLFDVCRFSSSGELRCRRNPTLEELTFMYGVIKAVSLLLKSNTPNFIQTVDVLLPLVQTPKSNHLVAVTLSHPPAHASSELEKEDDSKSIDTLRQCAECEKQVFGENITSCDHCNAIIYCTSVCQKQHWKESHKAVCGLYKAMMEREDELAINIFTFPSSNQHPCKYLDILGNGIHKKGMWRRKCPCYSHCPFGLLPTTDDNSWGGLQDDEYPHESLLQKTPLLLLSSWPEYYNLRSLPLSSPVADILSHPLTVYYILTTLSVISKNLLLKGEQVILHYIGPEDELDWMPAFTEISHILNGMEMGNVQIVMVGPRVPTNLSGSTLAIGSRASVNIVRGIYQEEAPYLPPPHVVIGLNCGFDSYSSWIGALEVIKSKGLSAFFSDRSELLCANAKQVIRGAGLHITHPVTPNPFRSPVRNYGLSTNLPCYSNGFVFGVNT